MLRSDALGFVQRDFPTSMACACDYLIDRLANHFPFTPDITRARSFTLTTSSWIAADSKHDGQFSIAVSLLHPVQLAPFLSPRLPYTSKKATRPNCTVPLLLRKFVSRRWRDNKRSSGYVTLSVCMTWLTFSAAESTMHPSLAGHGNASPKTCV